MSEELYEETPEPEFIEALQNKKSEPEFNEELKACPFCGSPLPTYDFGRHFANCYFILRAENKIDKNLMFAWNFRPIEDALRIEINEIQHGFELQQQSYIDLRAKLELAITRFEEIAQPIDMPTTKEAQALRYIAQQAIIELQKLEE